MLDEDDPAACASLQRGAQLSMALTRMQREWNNWARTSGRGDAGRRARIHVQPCVLFSNVSCLFSQCEVFCAVYTSLVTLLVWLKKIICALFVSQFSQESSRSVGHSSGWRLSFSLKKVVRTRRGPTALKTLAKELVEDGWSESTTDDLMKVVELSTRYDGTKRLISQSCQMRN